MTAAQGTNRLPRCVGCTGLLDEGDNFADAICQSCAARPDAARLLAKAASKPTIVRSAAAPAAVRFTPADRSLIKHLHGFVPVAELLRILNERLVVDQGGKAVPFTVEQLHTELAGVVDPVTGGDWAGVRHVLGQARRAGVLDAITPQVITDFAVVFQLAPAQLMHLRDVLAHAKENR